MTWGPEMDLRELTSEVWVTGQLDPIDMAALAAEGVRLIVCNRPDSEIAADQEHSRMEAAAQAAGMEFAFLPLAPGGLTPDLVADFGATISGKGKTVAYCRSGTRSATLWALSQAGRMSRAEIIERAAKAGYDLRQFAALLDAG